MTHYEVLGVAAGAGPDEVRAAYLRAARIHHPDRVAEDRRAEREAAEARMRDVNEAWRVLGDPDRRRDYDARLRRPPEPGADRGFQPFDLEDDPDPREAPDQPYRPPRESAGDRMVTMAPATLFATSIAGLLAGFIFSSPALLALAGVSFILSCVAVVAVALLSLARAARDE